MSLPNLDDPDVLRGFLTEIASGRGGSSRIHRDRHGSSPQWSVLDSSHEAAILAASNSDGLPRNVAERPQIPSALPGTVR